PPLPHENPRTSMVLLQRARTFRRATLQHCNVAADPALQGCNGRPMRVTADAWRPTGSRLNGNRQAHCFGAGRLPEPPHRRLYIMDRDNLPVPMDGQPAPLAEAAAQ